MSPSRSSSKGKLIAWCVLIAAVVIVYIGVTAHAKNATSTANTPAPTTSGTPAASANSGSPASSASYKDGTYSADASYFVPHSSESISVTLSVAGGTVKSVSIQQNPDNGESAAYQAAFRDSYQAYVVGKKLSDIQLSRVSGASLTSEGFNQALDQIRSQAQS